jgi:protein involved in polysaccharide export with SLBB domain
MDLIHFGDLIDVDVVGSFEYDWRGTLTPEGFLDGLERSEEQIYALCRSERDVAADIAREYSKTLRDPEVILKIVDRSNRAAAILFGAVKNPQRFQIRRPVRLRELLALSGGITETASGTIVIFRPKELNCVGTTTSPVSAAGRTKGDSSRSTTSINIKDLMEGKPEADPEILSGDVVTVADAPPIYVVGAVNNPRQIASRSGITLSRAVDEAGGEAKSAREVIVYRRGSGGSTIIEADLRRIYNGEMEDVELKPFDVVDVIERGGAKRKLAPRLPASPLYGAGVFRLPMRVID